MIIYKKIRFCFNKINNLSKITTTKIFKKDFKKINLMAIKKLTRLGIILILLVQQ